MENNAKEINTLVEQAKQILGLKVEQLSTTNSINSEIQHKIIELERRIKDLEDYTNEIEELYASNPNILLNFRKRTNDIKKEIELIK